MLHFSIFPLSQETVTHLTILLPAILLTLGLALSVVNDAYIERGHRRIMLIVCALVLVLIAQNYTDILLQTRYINPFGRTLCGIIGYSVRPVILVLFCHVVDPKRHYWLAWVLAGLNAAVYLTSLFSRLAFWINENNSFHRGPLNSFGFVVSIVLLVYLLYLSIREFRSEQRHKNHILLLPVLMIVGSVFLDYQVGFAEQPLTFLTYAIVLSSVFYYIWLHLQFVREHEQGLMAEQRIQIMLSQIKPHFLYNALGTIEELCDSDPKTAKAATVRFARYLRGNMNALSTAGTVPFEKELEHTRLYLELEQLRFEDALQIRYEIDCTDFFLPTLTLEPIVENAVRHGVRGNPDGRGTVVIASRLYPDHYEVSVSDDGPGFDPDAIPEDDEAHVGLRNVRDRLHSVCGGTLRIESAAGKGTTVTILLPMTREEK